MPATAGNKKRRELGGVVRAHASPGFGANELSGASDGIGREQSDDDDDDKSWQHSHDGGQNDDDCEKIQR